MKLQQAFRPQQAIIISWLTSVGLRAAAEAVLGVAVRLSESRQTGGGPGTPRTPNSPTHTCSRAAVSSS